MALSLEKLVPHQPPMRLIDEVLEVNADGAKCRTTITADNIFYDATIQGIYAWVGIEFMAQATAVFATFQGQNDKPQIGFLISVRNFSSTKPYFKLGEVLDVIIYKEYLAEEVGVFQGEIRVAEQVVVTAKLNAFQPPPAKIHTYLAGE